MSEKPIVEIAEGFGMTIEAAVIPEHAGAFRVFKGVNQVFIGTEEAVREFFVNYEKTRPTLYAGSMYGYKE